MSVCLCVHSLGGVGGRNSVVYLLRRGWCLQRGSDRVYLLIAQLCRLCEIWVNCNVSKAIIGDGVRLIMNNLQDFHPPEASLGEVAVDIETWQLWTWTYLINSIVRMGKMSLNFSTMLESRSQADWQDNAILEIRRRKVLDNLRECTCVLLVLVLYMYLVVQSNIYTWVQISWHAPVSAFSAGWNFKILCEVDLICFNKYVSYTGLQKEDLGIFFFMNLDLKYVVKRSIT